MMFRLLPAIIAAAILLAGCTQHARQGKYASGPAQAAPAGQSVYLRGQLPPAHQVATKPAMALTPVSHVPEPVVRPASAELPQQGNGGGAVYRLDSGDQLRIVVFGQDTLSNEYSIDGGGYISMPLIGPVPARGQTTFDLEERIASMLRQKYVKDPKVTVQVRTYRPFFILGEVRRPGQFPYVTGMTVQTAVAIAGGYTERARESKMKLTRKTGGGSQTLTVPQDYAVLPGDTVYINERLF